MTISLPLGERATPGATPDELFDAFVAWTTERGITLYPAQEEAIMEVVTGAHVVLSTPTGSGKSLVAVAAHFAALIRGERSYYTAPIKALVSEKFFALVEIFGADQVGMVTGDSSVNADAPIICCTAEIVANIALRQGADAPIGQVVMDEFHFYADPERGWAWQVPLLSLPRTQFVLMSATLGDVGWLAEDLSARTGRETAIVTGAERPIPLTFSYAVTPVHETVQELLDSGDTPVYVVHFSQLAALERAQALSSIKVVTREQRDAIADAIGGFRFTTNFGRTLSRLLRGGIGVHHAGMLPKYRRLVEQLAQQGLLKVICGTDTLGVGINVPIRTVLLTGLTKYDGIRMRHLTAREFHQVAGRAGRAGFDTAGTVIAQAPEHETENAKAVAKAGDDAKKLKKVVRKRAPEGFVSWGEPSYTKLIGAEPEKLTSTMRISHAMVINLIAQGGDVFTTTRQLLENNHEPRPKQLALIRQALAIFRTLRTAEVVTVDDGVIRLTVDLQPGFALNQPLSPFALAVFDLISPAEGAEHPPGFALDIISVLEATLDDPRPVLAAQQSQARGEAIAAMKAEGIEYDQRMELLDEITYPKPLDELLTAAFDTYRSSQPWVGDFELSPKTVVRDLYERAMTFNDYIGYYKLARSEGLVLRYLSDAYRAARQTIPHELLTDDLTDLIEWLGELVRGVDSSLLDEWESMIAPADDSSPASELAPPRPHRFSDNVRAFTVSVRNEMFRRVLLVAADDHTSLGELDAGAGFDAERWGDALDAYYAEHDAVGIDADARSSAMLVIEPVTGDDGVRIWHVQQILADPAGDHDWRITAEVSLDESDDAGFAVVRVTGMSRL